MMRAIRIFIKGVAIAIGILVILAAASFAVSNRTPVSLNLWPLPFEFSLPLGTTLLVTLAIGMVLGTALMTLSRLRLWYRARRNERKAAALERAAARQANEEAERPAGSDTALPRPSSRPALSEN